MGPNCGGSPTGRLSAAINDAFGSYDDFKSSVNDWELRKAFGEIWGVMRDNFGTGYDYE